MDTMHIAWLVAAAVVFGFAAIVSLVFPRAPELKAAGDGKQLPAVRPLRHHRSVVAMRVRSSGFPGQPEVAKRLMRPPNVFA